MDVITVKVSTQALREAADAIKTQLSTMNAAFEKLDATVNQTASYWESDAADHHRGVYAGFKEKMTAVSARINEQVTDLGVMAGVYEQAEAANAAVSEDLGDDIIS